MSFWGGKRVLVTGGSGFIGSHAVERLLELGARVRVVSRDPAKANAVLAHVATQFEHVPGDLTRQDAAARAVAGQEVVIHIAAFVAGVGYNSDHPATMLQRNVQMGLPIMTAAAEAGVERLVCVSSACVYPRFCTIPTPESEGFKDDPEPTNFGYGWAKRLLEVHARTLHEQYKIGVTIVRPYNGYGPRDNFSDQTSHVIPALIKRADRSEGSLVIWGDGQQTRSFMYVTDFVEGILTCSENSANADPVNIGADEEVTVTDLSQRIVNLVNPSLRLEFDLSKPKGQPRRAGDLSRARALGFAAKVPLSEGLARTVEWYRKTRPA